uniref:LRRCT domain-containing protein n=1 Tax=Branchiostoma floridae TaxID=7739 RepID=C3ZAV2_BRAFL|eukprot:XP_002593978.1 hypothetical protein BRAFLDRAFT_68584 [Branchiostoma floridae]
MSQARSVARMLRSVALVLFLLVWTHRHVNPAAAQGCPGSCKTNHQFTCQCGVWHSSLGEKSPCTWKGPGGTFEHKHCINAVPTGFQEGTLSIYIQHLRSPVLLEGSFPAISSLRFLRILWSNVSTVQPGAFRGLHSVSSLALSNNRISRLVPDTFLGLGRLYSLYLQNNAISSISPYAFRGLPRLSMLKLSNNQLTSVPVEALLQPKSLTKAKLDQNNIVAISRNILRLQQDRYLKIHVDNNKLRCDENLEWFICSLPHLQNIASHDDLKCASPAHLRGTLLTEQGPDVCQTNTGRSHEGIGYTTHNDVTTPSPEHEDVTTSSPEHEDATTPSPKLDIMTTPSPEQDGVTIPSPHNKTSATEEDTEMPYTNDVAVSQHTTEMHHVVILRGGPIINKDNHGTYTLAMIGAVFVPLLLVLASATLLFIFKRRCSACQAVPDQPTGTDEEDTEGSPNIEPYAVVYSGPDGLQASDNNSPTGSQFAPAPASADSETIQPYAVAYGDEDKGPASEIKPYAVAYDEDQGPEPDIQPYAVAYKGDAWEDESCKIPLYAAEGPDTSQAAGGCTEAGSTQAAIVDQPVTQPEAGSTPLEIITNQHRAIIDQLVTQPEAGSTPLEIITNQHTAIIDQPVTQPKERSPPTDADTEPKDEEEEEGNEASKSSVLYNQAIEQPEIKGHTVCTPNALYNPAHGQPESKDSTSHALYNPAIEQPEIKGHTPNALYNPAYGQPESIKDSTSHALYNPAHGQPESIKDSTSHTLYNPAHGQPESKDSTSHALYNPAHGQPQSQDSTPHALYNPADRQPEVQTSGPSMLYGERLIDNGQQLDTNSSFVP